MKRFLPLLFLFTPLFSIGQFTAIPDPVFEQELIDLGYDNFLNGEVFTADISGVLLLDLDYLGINDLTGIQDFASLLELRVQGNNLTTLDVGNLQDLTVLICATNDLVDIDVSGLPSLELFQFHQNPITSVDVSNNLNLESVNCAYTQLDRLDLSHNNKLIALYALDCPLTCLNMKNGNNINVPNTYFGVLENPNLTCIEVDDVAWSTANWTVTNMNIEPWMSFSTDCNNPCSSTWVGVEEYSKQPKKLIRIIDYLGRETTFKPNTPLIYIYDDGSVEKVIREY